MIDPNIETVDYIYDQITRCLHDKEYDKLLPKLIDEQFSKLYSANERVLDYLED
jgi:hypothetical protein